MFYVAVHTAHTVYTCDMLGIPWPGQCLSLFETVTLHTPHCENTQLTSAENITQILVVPLPGIVGYSAKHLSGSNYIAINFWWVGYAFDR